MKETFDLNGTTVEMITCTAVFQDLAQVDRLPAIYVNYLDAAMQAEHNGVVFVNPDLHSVEDVFPKTNEEAIYMIDNASIYTDNATHASVQLDEEALFIQKRSTLTVLRIDPLEPPVLKTIAPGLEALQHEVGGYIEFLSLNQSVGLICNDAGKMNHMPLNRAMYLDTGEIYDIIAGSFLVVGIDDSDFCSLTPDQIETYTERFRTPEQFIRMNNEIIRIPVPVKESLAQMIQTAKDSAKLQNDVHTPKSHHKTPDLEA